MKIRVEGKDLREGKDLGEKEGGRLEGRRGGGKEAGD